MHTGELFEADNPTANEVAFLSAVQRAAWEKDEGVLVRVKVSSADRRLGGKGSYSSHYTWSFDTKPFTKEAK